jgi:hypothetical protein
MDIWSNKHEKGYNSRKNQPSLKLVYSVICTCSDHGQPRYQIWIKCDKIGHDLNMPILYRFHVWLIFARVIALFMFVWPYVRSHILCMQLVICLLSHFIHIWYLDWPSSEYVHIICTRCRAVIPPLALHKLMCSKVLDYSGTCVVERCKTLCDKVCQWLVVGLWFFLRVLQCRHDKIKILCLSSVNSCSYV